MPVRQTRIFARSDEPLEGWAETLIGRVLRPLTSEFERELEWFWFSRYGAYADDSEDCDVSLIPDEYKRPLAPGDRPFHRSIRFRFNVPDRNHSSAFEQRAMELIDAGRYRISDFRDYDFVSDTASNRFLGVENRQPSRAERRAVLTTTFYYAISRLVLDALVGPDEGGRFRMETSDDRQNARGSPFQSLLHLYCNITDVPTDVYVFHNPSMNLVSYGTYPPAELPAGWESVARYPVRF